MVFADPYFKTIVDLLEGFKMFVAQELISYGSEHSFNFPTALGDIRRGMDQVNTVPGT